MTKNILKPLIEWLTLSGLIIAIGFIWVFFIWPLQRQVIEVRDTSVGIKERRIRLIEHKTALDQLGKQKNAIDDLSKRAIAYLPEKADVADFVLQLEEMVKSLGYQPPELNVAEDQPTQTSNRQTDTDEQNEKKKTNGKSSTQAAVSTSTSKKSPAQTSSFNVTFSGTFESIQQFLTLLKSVDRFNTLESINLTYGTAGLNAKFVGKVYHESLASFSIKADQSVAKLDPSAQNLLDRKHFGDPLSIPTIPPTGSKDPFGKL